ncbi:hypothetical protein PTI98_004422 [Pleurotus ostreatus]|nr:hypothetical protein PTI98_004422 [Pleurotus ostreatus]
MLYIMRCSKLSYYLGMPKSKARGKQTFCLINDMGEALRDVHDPYPLIMRLPPVWGMAWDAGNSSQRLAFLALLV